MPLKDDDIKQLIAILQRGLSNDDEEPSVTSQPTETEDSPIRTKRSGSAFSASKKKKQNVQKRTNKFDTMMEKDMHKNDTKIDQLLCVHPPTIRTREFEPIKVQCRVCHKVEEISPNLIYDAPERYKCNKCSGAPG